MIRAQSKARARQMREYAKQRQAYLIGHPFCEAHQALYDAGIADFGPHWSTEIHHTRGRAGSLLLDEKFWLAVCWKCHIWITAHPVKSRTFALLAPLGSWNQTEKLRQQKERNAAS